MSWYPRSVRKEIRPGASDPPIEVIGAVLHVAVSNADSLFGWFDGDSGGIESHFYIRYDGIVEQYRDTGREADANYKANSFVERGVRKGYVSIETAGMEHGGWTAAQLSSIKLLLTWLAAEHDFPLQRVKAHTEPGVGYHTMFGAPGPWTPAVGKTCPGPGRVKQFDRVIVPWMREHGTEPRPKPEGGYIVRPGDTLAAIAKRFDTTVGAIAKANGIKDPDVIAVGQRLDLSAPAPKSKPVVLTRPKPRPAPKIPAFPGRDAFVLGKRNRAVTALDKALKAKGFDKHHDGDGYQPGPLFSEYTRQNVAAFQRSRPELAADADGIPGPLTWKALHS